jgi:AcrR family transcriptional regulator
MNDRHERDVIAMLLEQADQGPKLRKRERTRKQLVLAAIRVIAESGLAATTTGQIAQAAGVTAVTFYNYFKSKAEIVSAVALFIAETLRQRSAPSRAELPTGAERLAAGCLRYLHLAEISPAFATLVVEVAEAEPALLQRIGAFVQGELRAGIKERDFVAQREAAALDLVIGAVIRGMRRIAGGGAPRGYRGEITVAILCGLGLPRAKAAEIVARPLDALIGRVP